MSNTINLYRADTGAFLGKVNIGDGLRAKSWLDELPSLLLEAATQRGLTADGYGVLANFPAFLDGSKTQSRPIGEALSAKPLNRVDLYQAVPQTEGLGTGDASATAFGDQALTQPNPSVADYGNTGSNPANPPIPRGARSPAWLLSNTGAGNYDLSLTSGILTIVVNGVSFPVSVGIGAATTIAQVVSAIQASGAPVRVDVNNTNFILISTTQQGRTQNLMVVNTAGTAGAVIYATQGGVVRFGNGSPLGQMDNASSVASGLGIKSQRRILPLSLSITMTMGGELITARELTVGVITGSNIAGTVTVTGTVNDATGDLEFDTVGDQPDTATAITAFYKALIPIDLSTEVKVPVGGMDLAILVS